MGRLGGVYGNWGDRNVVEIRAVTKETVGPGAVRFLGARKGLEELECGEHDMVMDD